MSIKNKLQSIIKNSLPIDLDINRIVIDIPKDKKNGDYSTNVAFLLTKELKKSPILIAEDIANNIKDEDRKSTRLNSSHPLSSRMPSSA